MRTKRALRTRDAYSITSSTQEELRGWGWLDALHADDREYSARQWSEAVDRGTPMDTQCRLRHAASGRRWVQFRPDDPPGVRL